MHGYILYKKSYMSYNSCRTKVISGNNEKINKLIKRTKITTRIIKPSLKKILFQVSG